jgi:hypothetical protein
VKGLGVTKFMGIPGLCQGLPELTTVHGPGQPAQTHAHWEAE